MNRGSVLRIQGVLLAAVLTALAPLRAEVTTSIMRVAGEELPSIGFDLLASYPYKIVDLGTGATPAEIEEAKKIDQVPASVRAFDGKRVVLTGYMMPLKLDKGLAVSFILMKDVTTCCYGATPSMNDYLIVTMKEKGVEVIQDVPVQVSGTLSIRQTYEEGYIVSLYTFAGDKFLGVRK
jgi:hypothetical protein